MSKSVAAWLSIGLVTITMGCGSGSRDSGPTGNVCDPNINPIPIEMDKNARKINLDPQAGELGLFPGIYSYEGAQLFYRNSATQLQIYVSEVRNAKDATKFDFTTNCVSGVTPTTGKVSVNLAGLIGMTVPENKTDPTTVKISDIKVRNYFLGFSNFTLVRKADEDKESRFEAPNKVYEGKISEYGFYKVAPTNDSVFQFRAKVTEGTETVYLLIRYKRAPIPADINADQNDRRFRR